MLEKEQELFKKYVSNYDLNDPKISLKYYHSFRVVEYSIEIAKSLNINDEAINLAGLIGLLHDIGRFEQHRIYGTYSDYKSIDHGDLGVSILKENDYINEYIEDEDKKKIVLLAIKNHNKLSIDENLDEQTKMFCKIIRDADKIDIMDMQNNDIIDDGIVCYDGIMKCIYNNTLSTDSDKINPADKIARMLCFIFDFNFEYTYKCIIDKNIILRKIKLLDGHIPEKYNINEIENILNNYINERMIKYEN